MEKNGRESNECKMKERSREKDKQCFMRNPRLKNEIIGLEQLGASNEAHAELNGGSCWENMTKLSSASVSVVFLNLCRDTEAKNRH